MDLTPDKKRNKRLQKKLDAIKEDFEGQKQDLLERHANRMLKVDEKFQRLKDLHIKGKFLDLF